MTNRRRWRYGLGTVGREQDNDQAGNIHLVLGRNYERTLPRTSS